MEKLDGGKKIEVIEHNGRYRVVVARPNNVGGWTIEKVISTHSSKAAALREAKTGEYGL